MPEAILTNSEQGAVDNDTDINDKMFDFQSARVHLNRLVSDWKQEIEDTENRRKERKLQIDVEQLRQDKTLDEDETIIPIRVIDTNIQREMPAFINYLKNSRRLAIFESVDDPNTDVDLLEQNFTKCSTYTKWELPHFRVLDGSKAHGWDTVEVTYDESKPGHYAIEHIGHDNLLFPRSALDLQACPRILRSYDVTLLQLKRMVQRYEFDSEQVDLIFKSRKETQKENETLRIYKMFFKKDSVVYITWFSLTDGVMDWLKQPAQHYVGIDMKLPTGMFAPKPLELYPIFLLPYRETEEQRITDHKGRCFLDQYKQEAQTAMWSAFVNGMTRASNMYACPETDDGSGSSLKEIQDVVLKGGRVLSKPIKFFHTDYPDPVVLRTLQFADVSNSAETNQVSFAAMNREDSRKTAKEISAAQQQQGLLNSVELTLFSTFIREVYSFAWLIVQSQALQNKIIFLQKAVQQPSVNPINPAMPMVDPNTNQPMMQTIYTNDVETIGKTYVIRAAGDVDIIQKEEILNKMRQDFQLMMQTPLKDQFLADYVRLSYPERADKYGQLLGQQDEMNKMKSLIGRLSTMLDGVLKDAPQIVSTLPQQQQSDLASTMQEAQQITGAQLQQ